MVGLLAVFVTIWTLGQRQVGADPARRAGALHRPLRQRSYRGGGARLPGRRGADPAALRPLFDSTLVHELAHAYDCQDNGVMDGSLISRPEERPAWASDYCWTVDAEWYACSAVQYRNVFPDAVAPWGDATVATAAAVEAVVATDDAGGSAEQDE